MNGIFVEKSSKDGIDVWTVRDVTTRELFAVGDSILDAVTNYETYAMNAEISNKLGVFVDDMDV